MKTKLRSTLLMIAIVFNANAQICSPPSAIASLDISNARVGLLNGGDFWWDGVSSSRYEIPKSTTNITKNVLFSGGIWLSALDHNNNLKVAAMTYRQLGAEFYPGPISNTSGTTTFQQCNFYDRFWEITKSEINNHRLLSQLQLPIPISQIAINILEWPGKGNTHLSNITIEDDLAPFIDYNHNNIYDPQNGDYPKVIGDQTFFWVMNDIGGFHTIFGGDPLKVQVQLLAHAFASPSSLLYNSTIYECKIINKSFGNLHDFNFGLYSDPEIGIGTDDKIGCDTLRNSAFAYNGQSLDPIYGVNPPIVSIPFLNQKMTSYGFLINSGPLTNQNPASDIDINNFLHGQDFNGTPFCLYGGFSTSCIPSNFMFPGNPNNPLEVSLCSVPNASGTDFRMVQSSGGHDLDAWSSFDIAFATHVTFPILYDGCPDMNTDFGMEVDELKLLYDSLLIDNSTVGILEETFLEAQVNVYPNPYKDILSIDYGNLQLKEMSLYSIDGKLISSVDDNKLQIADLNPGLYLLEINFKEGRVVKKIIKD